MRRAMNRRWITLPLLLLVLAAVACKGPAGPQGPAGPPGPPGPPGAGALSLYVRDSGPVTVAVSTTDVRTVSCDAGDAATGAATQRDPDPGVPTGGPTSSHLSTVPTLSGTTPTGVEFTLRCASGGGCPVVHRVICADLTP